MAAAVSGSGSSSLPLGNPLQASSRSPLLDRAPATPITVDWVLLDRRVIPAHRCVLEFIPIACSAGTVGDEDDFTGSFCLRLPPVLSMAVLGYPDMGAEAGRQDDGYRSDPVSWFRREHCSKSPTVVAAVLGLGLLHGRRELRRRLRRLEACVVRVCCCRVGPFGQWSRRRLNARSCGDKDMN